MNFLILLITEVIILLFLARQNINLIQGLLATKIKSQEFIIRFLFILLLPGVIIHELSHLLFAGILFVPVGEMELFPRIQEKNVRLGSVQVGQTDPIRRMIIGVAPIIVGFPIVIGLVSLIPKVGSFGNFYLSAFLIFLAIYLIFTVTATLFSSRKDLEGTLELILVFIILGVIFYAIGFRAPLFWLFDFIQKPSTISFFKNLSILLLVPLLLNVSIFSLLYLLERKR